MFDGTKGWHCEDYDFDEVIDAALDIDFEYEGHEYTINPCCYFNFAILCYLILHQLFRIDKNSLCSIELYLHGGDISLPFDVKKRKDFYETGYCKRYCCTAQRQINKFSKMLKSDGEICIWLSRKCIDEYLGMLWTVYNYKNYAKNIFLCDCTELVDAIA